MSVNVNSKSEEIIRSQDVIIDEHISFNTLLLSESTLSGLKQCGFIKPSPIQMKSIPMGKCGFDLLVKSKSGTGKTAVFGIVALEMIDVKKTELQVLVLAPTREIAFQICNVISSIGVNYTGLKTECFIGGLPIEDDVKKLTSCHIAVGAPGRVKHLIDKNHLKTEGIKLFVLDEADKLMESSFQSDINYIYHKLPLRKQMIALSATYPDELDKYLSRYMHKPTHVNATKETPLLLGLRHFVSVVKTKMNVLYQMNIKIDEIIRLLSNISFGQCLIFTNFQTHAESISNNLNRKGWASTYISASQTQVERLETLKSLKDFTCRILLSTDLTARGIDAINIDLVINVDVPHDTSTYLHRMGRAGRYGSKGICVTLASAGKELAKFQDIIGMIGGKQLSLPKLPADTMPSNLWESDDNSFEQVWGTIDENCPDEKTQRLRNIKESILELKKSDKDIKNENAKNSDDTEIAISTDVSVVTDVTPITHEIDPMELLRKPSDGTDIAISTDVSVVTDVTPTTQEMDPMELLRKLANMEPISPGIPPETNFISVENVIGSLNDSQNETHFETVKSNKTPVQQQSDSNRILRKNVSLFNVSKLLVGDDDFNSETEIIDNLKGYIDEVENVEVLNIARDLKDTNNTDILNSLLNIPSNDAIKPVDPENVFVYGFDYMMNSSNRHWLDVLGETFDENVAEEGETEQKINLLDFYDYDEEDSEDLVVAKHKQKYKKRHSRKRKNVLSKYSNECIEQQPISLYNTNEIATEPEYPQNDQYAACFSECNTSLAERVYEFEDVQSFDQYFLQWQQQVQSVRDYVQQNVYLDEMNYYRYYKNPTE